MDFSSWSPSHTILVLFGIAVFIGQVGVYFYRTRQNDKQLEKQGETFLHAIERLEQRMDKGFVEVNQQIVGVRDELRSEIGGVRGEITNVREELRGEIQGVRDEITNVREELRGEIQGVRGEITNVREELRGEIGGARDELRSEIGGVRGEIADVRTEMNQRLSDMTAEISKLNQNHIDHLTHHES